MKFKLTAIVMIGVLLVGCSNNITIEVNKKDWRYEEKYNVLANSNSSLNTLVELEEGILLFPIVNKEGDNTMVFYDDKKKELSPVSNNVEKKCELTNLEVCSLIGEMPSNFHYYNGYIYYVVNGRSTENEVATLIVKRRTLDNSNEEDVFTFEQSIAEDSDAYNGTMAFYYQMHKGYLYYPKPDKQIARIELETMKEEIFSIGFDSASTSLFFYGDICYVNSANVKMNDKQYSNVILEVSLKETSKVDAIMQFATLYYIDNDFMVYIKDSEKNEKTFLYNMKTKEEKVLLDSYARFVYKTDQYYILDNVGFAKENEKGNVYLFDRSFNLLDKIESPYFDHSFSQGVIRNRYYIYLNDENKYIVFPIEDNKFKEMEEILL